MQKREWLRYASAAGAASLLGPLGLSGCASFTQLSVEVRSFGAWPAGRAPGSYAIDRLPSQQDPSDVRQMAEDAAQRALQAAGFVPASPGAEPDVLLQLGLRIQRSDPSPWDDPLWWPGGWGFWRHHPWRGPVWGVRPRFENPRYERQVALLLRDRRSGKPLYEAHASSEGFSSSLGGLLVPMFSAALQGFPVVQPEARLVRMPI